MRRIALFLQAMALLGGLLPAVAAGQTDGEAAPIYGIKLPPDYRDWTLISLANVGSPVRVAGKFVQKYTLSLNPFQLN